MFNFSSFVIIAASNVIRKDQMVLTKFISDILGWVLNLIFNVIYPFAKDNSLGISIILMTIFVRFCMFPLAIKQQKSMFIMQKIQPEIKKIQEKYKEKSADPEIQKKMNMEMQKLYAKHKYNPFSGCLPLLIQLPIFISLYFIMQNPYLFIDHVNNIYSEIGNILINSANFADVMRNFVLDKVPEGMRPFDFGEIKNLLKILNVLTPSEWNTLAISYPNIDSLLETKKSIEFFCGINLTETVGYSFPKVLIAIFSGLTTLLSSWLITKNNKTTDPAMKSQQRIMNITMPLLMAYITTGLPGGVGLYWITSNVFQIFQQIILNSYYRKKYETKE